MRLDLNPRQYRAFITGFTPEEQQAIHAACTPHDEPMIMGSFATHLWRAIIAADSGNRERLALAYPEKVAAWTAWTHGDLAKRFEAMRRAHAQDEPTFTTEEHTT